MEAFPRIKTSFPMSTSARCRKEFDLAACICFEATERMTQLRYNTVFPFLNKAVCRIYSNEVMYMYVPYSMFVLSIFVSKVKNEV